MNGYAPGTIQTDLGMCGLGFTLCSLGGARFLMSFSAIEAEKVAGGKTIQEVCRCPTHSWAGFDPFVIDDWITCKCASG